MAKTKKVTPLDLKGSKKAQAEAFAAIISNDFGEEIYLGENVKQIYDRLVTGIPSFDLGFGGGPVRGKIIEIFGPESSGKTTTCLTIIKKDQEQNPDSMALIIDNEHALDFDYMFNPAKLGLDKSRVHIVQPGDLKASCAIWGKAAESGLYSIIVLDSSAAKVKEEDVETDYTSNDKAQATEARVLSQCLSKSSDHINKHKTIGIITSQIRASMAMYGAKEVTTGGNSIKFYASVRIETRRVAQEKVGDVITHNKVRLKFVKNKTGIPYREVILRLDFGTGFNEFDDVIDHAVNSGSLDRAGAWYKFNGENIAQGRTKLTELLTDNPGLYRELLDDVYSKIDYNQL
jgi:recombination protein RecA